MKKLSKMPKQRVTDNNMRLTESQLRSVIRKLLAEWTPALKADAEWADLTDGSGPISGLLSGKTVDQAIKDLYGHLSDLEMDELKDQFPELDADIISSGDEAEALDHLRVVVTAIHAENEKDYARDAVRQDLMYFATKSKRPELKALQQRVLDPKEPEYTITSLAYEEDLKAVLGKLEDEVASLSDEEAKRLRNILSAEEDEDRFMRPRPESDPKLDPDAATVPGIKEAGKKSNHDPNYGAPEGSKRDKQLDATKADLKSGDPKRVARAYRRRKRMEDKARSEPGYKNKPRKDTKKESVQMPETALRKVIRSVLEEELNKKTKATLKKKAEKRGLTPGSVEAEFKKGLAAFVTSGSRKGMSAHQWAHARVNSATPSKPWAVVKKSKAKKKKKK
jgi:hypothetical protein